MASTTTATPILSPTTATPILSPTTTTATSSLTPQSRHTFTKLPLPKSHGPITKLHVSSSPKNPTTISTVKPTQETIFFDGGAHYGDLVANLVLGFTLVWLPLTVAAISRAFFLRYRFTDIRVTVISGLTGQDRSDFSYSVIKDVQVVPRFVGEWGDIIITLKDGTKVDLRSVPKFREIAKYCLALANNDDNKKGKNVVLDESGPKVF